MNILHTIFTAPVTHGPEVHTDPCQEQQDECNALHCEFGVTRNYDAQNCERCQCENPCQYHSCPQDSGCSVDQQQDSQGHVAFVPVCRESNCNLFTNLKHLSIRTSIILQTTNPAFVHKLPTTQGRNAIANATRTPTVTTTTNAAKLAAACSA